MTYSSLYQKNKFRIPSIVSLGIVGLVSSIAAGLLLSPSQRTQASKKNITAIHTTNISASKATVFWQTSEKEKGIVFYGTTPDTLTSVALDERDTETNKMPYFNHLATISDLKADTQYHFKISNEKEILQAGNTALFSFKTAPRDNRVSSLKPAYGKVYSRSGKPLEHAVVLLTHPLTRPVSTLTKASGEWLIPLNGLVSKSNQSLFTPAESDSISISFFDEEGNQSSVKTRISVLSPLPETVIMGKSYSFGDESQVLAAITETPKTVITQAKVKEPFSILYPLNKASIPVGNPLIKGTAETGSNVILTLQSPVLSRQIKETVQSDGKGIWKYSLTSPLQAGTYTLTASISQPVYASVNRSFTITKSGQQVLAEATSSATITPTLTITLPVTNTPTPTSPPMIPTEITPTLPASGSTIANLLFSGAALILLGAGLMVVF